MASPVPSVSGQSHYLSASSSGDEDEEVGNNEPPCQEQKDDVSGHAENGVSLAGSMESVASAESSNSLTTSALSSSSDTTSTHSNDGVDSVDEQGVLEEERIEEPGLEATLPGQGNSDLFSRTVRLRNSGITTSAKPAPLNGRGDALNSGIFASIRKSGRKILSPVLGNRGIAKEDDAESYRDIVSITIRFQMWHITNMILSNLDAVSLETCEEVCKLWRKYILGEKIWRRVVEGAALGSPDLVKQNGWFKFIPMLGGKEPNCDDVYRDIYWKMTNLSQLWQFGEPQEKKNHIKRSGPIQWCFLPTGRSVHVFNSGRGYALKIHDDMTHRSRHTNIITLGTVKNDTLCVDATPTQIAVGGQTSQRVWVFAIKEGQHTARGPLNAILDSLRRRKWRQNALGTTRIYTELFKFINAGAGVARVKLHTDGERIAVLLPLNQTVEVWHLVDVVRLQSFAVPSDCEHLIWRDELLVTAPTYSGIIQTMDTKNDREVNTVSGSIRRIFALAVCGKLCATGESRFIKLWNLNTSSHLRTWSATKSIVTALFMNDAMLVSGSGAGIVKIWDLRSVLRKDCSSVQILRKVSMKGILHYPIKFIDQLTYEDLVIVAKYEGKTKKDKVKLIRVRAD